VLAFTGEYPQKIDGKGRMSIPADFRRVLEAGDPDWTEGLNPKIYLQFGDHLKDNLRVYSVNEFDRIYAQIRAMPSGTKEKQMVSRLYLGQSMKLEIDRDGRIVMPIRQRRKLGLEQGEVLFMGVGDYFEIWKADTFETTVGQDAADWLGEQPEGFDPLSLVGGL
jgi:MraZ protein